MQMCVNQCFERVWSNVISVTRWWGCVTSGKKHYGAIQVLRNADGGGGV